VINLTISNGTIFVESSFGAGIGSGDPDSEKWMVERIEIVRGRLRATETSGSAIGVSYLGHKALTETQIVSLTGKTFLDCQQSSEYHPIEAIGIGVFLVADNFEFSSSDFQHHSCSGR
jgi:hypothetical protein